MIFFLFPKNFKKHHLPSVIQECSITSIDNYVYSGISQTFFQYDFPEETFKTFFTQSPHENLMPQIPCMCIYVVWPFEGPQTVSKTLSRAPPSRTTCAP